MSTFANIHTIENVKLSGVGGQKSLNLVNVVCERPLRLMLFCLQEVSEMSNTIRFAWKLNFEKSCEFVNHETNDFAEVVI